MPYWALHRPAVPFAEYMRTLIYGAIIGMNVGWVLFSIWCIT
ncbi:MAG: hypothetical protein ACTSRP_27630 [Candidatus Helarchaeota archaeon]